MLKYILLAVSLALTAPAQAHVSSKFAKGPHGGHLIDAGGGKQHWELVASGGELTLYVTDVSDKPLETAGASAQAQVLVGGQTYTVKLVPAGGNVMKGSGPFTASKGMRVIVKTEKVGGESFQARLTPLE